jgi:folate-binding protein YgfZ
MLKVSTIRVDGIDAFEFLQGQLSNDLKRLDAEAEILAAWCNPKGRVIWFGAVHKTDTGYELSAPAETAENIVQRLTMFRFRSKVEFNIVADATLLDPTSLISNGHPYIGLEQSEKFTPHMLNLDLLDAISLDKGCYTGQEIVARTHYKGATKRRTIRFEGDAAVTVGGNILAGDTKIGEVLNADGKNCLAVVAVDKIDDQLVVNDVKLSLIPLAYLDLT